MPLYEYQCTHCGEKFEARQSIGEGGSKLKCPNCGAVEPQKLFSSFFSTSSDGSMSSDISCPTCGSGICGLPPMM
jgi:putative FmdB family regulatory protein